MTAQTSQSLSSFILFDSVKVDLHACTEGFLGTFDGICDFGEVGLPKMPLDLDVVTFEPGFINHANFVSLIVTFEVIPSPPIGISDIYATTDQRLYIQILRGNDGTVTAIATAGRCVCRSVHKPYRSLKAKYIRIVCGSHSRQGLWLSSEQIFLLCHLLFLHSFSCLCWLFGLCPRR